MIPETGKSYYYWDWNLSEDEDFPGLWIHILVSYTGERMEPRLYKNHNGYYKFKESHLYVYSNNSIRRHYMEWEYHPYCYVDEFNSGKCKLLTCSNFIKDYNKLKKEYNVRNIIE
jgi:hypothetical protein